MIQPEPALSDLSNRSVEDKPWFRRYRPSPTASARLVCLPHAGGSASFFLPVAAALSPGVDVIAVQYPGRQDRRTERALTDVGALADRISDLLLRQPLGAIGPAADQLTDHLRDEIRAWSTQRDQHQPTVIIYPADTPDGELPGPAIDKTHSRLILSYHRPCP